MVKRLMSRRCSKLSSLEGAFDAYAFLIEASPRRTIRWN